MAFGSGFHSPQVGIPGSGTALQDCAPSDSGGGEEGQSKQHVVEAMIQDILDVYRDVVFDMDDIAGACDDPGPFQNVFLQECERMRDLLAEIVRSLIELDLGFRGDLTMSDAMEEMCTDLFLDKVPASWVKLAYASQRPLGSWLADLERRIAQLQDWVANPLETPHVTWISGLFNPQSFLTAIMQVTAQKASLELDKLVIQTDVLSRSRARGGTSAARSSSRPSRRRCRSRCPC